jgi:hypothetical protein
VLKYATGKPYFGVSDLRDLLSNRVIGLIFSEKISDTGINNLIDELFLFKWITPWEGNSSHGTIYYCLTDLGRQSIKDYETNPAELFYVQLIANLHEVYAIPGWFIQRLWDINTKDQGLVIIPAPPKNWNPKARKWEKNIWDIELENVTRQVHETVQTISKYSFPIEIDLWIKTVKLKWDRLSTHQKKRKSKKRKIEDLNEKNELFAPRKRLALAMKEAAVELLFSNANIKTRSNDFENYRYPLVTRKLQAWSSRLEELGLLYYTDYNQKIPGRLIFPISVFRREGNSNFQIIESIKNPEGLKLCIYKPKWNSYKITFLETLFDEYTKKHIAIKSLYVSVQDIRDEVCRVLRINYISFNEFLGEASIESSNNSIHYRISLESDIREDQRAAYQLSRRPIYVRGKVVTIIAITQIESNHEQLI